MPVPKFLFLKRSLPFLALFLLMPSVHAQEKFPDKLDELRLDLYVNYMPLDEVFDTIGEMFGIPVQFNREIFSEVKYTHLFERTNLNRALDIISRESKKFSWVYWPEMGITIQAQEEMLTNYQQIEAMSNYTGPAERRNITINGKVVDEESGESLPFVNIGIFNTSIGTSTNAAGFYTLYGVPTDTSTIVFKYLGYVTMKYKLNPQVETDNMIIKLMPSSIELEEIEIVEERDKDILFDTDETSMVKLAPRQIARLPNVGEKDPLRAMQLMPGVSASNESSSGLFVRGGTPDQNLILYDGFTVYHVDHLYGFYSAFNSNAIKDIQLFKGGFEPKFGGRISSVTQITGKDGNSENFNMGASISLLSVNAFAEIPVGTKLTTMFAFRRSFKGPLYNTIFEKYNEEEEAVSRRGGRASVANTVSSYFYDVNAKLTYHVSDNNKLSFSFFNGTDKLDNSLDFSTSGFGNSNSLSNNVNSDITSYGNMGSSILWSRKWNDKFFSDFLLSYSNYYSTRDKTREMTIVRDDATTTFKSGLYENNDLFDYSIKSDFEYRLNNNHSIEFGTFGSLCDISYEYRTNDTISILDRQDGGIIAGGYGQYKLKLFDTRFNFVPGLRSSYFDLTGKWYWEPRLSTHYKINKHLKANASWGYFYQFANRITREDITEGSRDFWILSNGDNVPVSKAIHYILGLSWENRMYLFSLEGFYKDLYGLSEYSMRFSSSFREVSYEENFYNGIGYARGIEVLAQKKFGKFTGWLSYTFLEAKNQFDVYGDEYFSSSQDVTHEFKAVGLYTYKKFDFSATWIYATGRPYTAPLGGYQLSLLDGTSSDYIIIGSKNAARLPDYHRLDLAINYNLFIHDNTRNIGSIGFSIFNLYGRKNTWYKEFQIEDGEIIEIDQQFMGFTPNISLTLKIR